MKTLGFLRCLALLCWSGLALAATRPAACPADLPEQTQCFNGWDEAGAGYWIALPAGWKNSAGVLVLHSHGGPELGTPKLERSAGDLQRWKVVLRAGHAWAGSTFRQGGVAVHSAAEDTERLRQLFIERFGRPRLTLLHGQSWGAGVAAVAAELYPSAYDGVLLTSGVLGGGTRSYDFRLDLRVVWQALCHNHPRPGEPAYPLWQGLPEGATMTRAELNQRIDECIGLSQPAAARNAAQQQRLKSLLAVIRIPERSLAGHLAWGTFHFQDIAFQRLGGRNAFGNIGARYRGSDDDDALNAAVQRYRADPGAVATFGADTDPGGRIAVPVLSVRAIDDPVAFVELDTVFAQTMARGGNAARLVQTYTDDHEHSYLSDVQYVAALHALLAWVEHGDKPSPAALAERCKALETDWGAACRYRPDYRPAPLDSRVTPRER
jgi:pimeloyl-ACP methyl ester carboxylesterase